MEQISLKFSYILPEWESKAFKHPAIKIRTKKNCECKAARAKIKKQNNQKTVNFKAIQNRKYLSCDSKIQQVESSNICAP